MNPFFYKQIFQQHTDLGPLGVGGYGEVRKALLNDGRLVAVKYVRENTPEHIKALSREVCILEEFAGEDCFVQILGKNLNCTRPYFYMELCDRTFQDWIPGLDREQKLNGISRIVRAVRILHQRDGVQGDIKPANMLMRRNGNVISAVLSDFGVARTPNPGTMMTRHCAGTPPFIAPEVVDGQPCTAASDIFSLGMSFYAIFTGEAVRPWLPVSVPGNLSNLLYRMTDTHPFMRPSIYDVEREVTAAIEMRKSAIIYLTQYAKNPIIRGTGWHD